MSRRSSYYEYLKSPHWKSLRALKIKQHGNYCNRCRSSKRIQVHHLIYRHPWELALLSDLEVLCKSCHQGCHPEKRPSSFACVRNGNGGKHRYGDLMKGLGKTQKADLNRYSEAVRTVSHRWKRMPVKAAIRAAAVVFTVDNSLFLPERPAARQLEKAIKQRAKERRQFARYQGTVRSTAGSYTPAIHY